jgi:hypothetical protein
MMSLGAGPEDDAIPRGVGVWDHTSWELVARSPDGRMIQAELKARYGLLLPDRGLLFLPGGLDRQARLTVAPGVTGDEDDLADLVFASDPRTGEPLGQIVAHIIAHPQCLPAAEGELVLAGESIRGAAARRYFEVPEGTLYLDLQLSVPEDQSGVARGLVRGFVYGPGGYLAAETGLVGYGAAGHGSVSLYNPSPGIWELVTWAAPEYSGGNGRSAFEWRAGGRVLSAAVSPQRIQVQAQPGAGTVQARVELQLPPESPEILVGVMGWTPGQGFRPWRAMLEAAPDMPALWDLPDVEAGVGLLEISAAPMGLSDVDLYVYRLQTPPPGQPGPVWAEVGRSARAATGAELVSVWDPVPGSYAVMVEVAGEDRPETVSLEARRWANGWFLLDEVAVPAGASGDSQVALELPLPVGPAGQYVAEVVVREASSLRVLASAGLTVDKGVPGLLALIAPSLGWRQAGAESPAPAALVISGESLQGVDGDLRIGERTSRAIAGRIVLDRSVLGGIAGPGLEVTAEAAAQGYSPWGGVLAPRGAVGGRLTVGDVSGQPPYPPESGEQSGLRASLRLKCTWQWRP